MNQLITNPAKRKHHRRRYASSRRTVPGVPVGLPSVDWSALLNLMPQEPPQSLADAFWNVYKDKVWTKFQPDGRVAFEGLRMIGRDNSLPAWLRLLADVGAGLCVLDGYGASAEGLRREEQARRLARTMAPKPQLFAAWPSYSQTKSA